MAAVNKGVPVGDGKGGQGIAEELKDMCGAQKA